ncbi:uncharacterized protein KY384_005497 [Bacidia gigantensis]|uniref:uncharacterized protein n=1 Tax=Bacidia gigantensis TaxID=2732470 RepID=UPI001D05BF4B|nr:uncharacterized protein KY384_005497 [Bacidia gigantensis]KAG8530015.1 hypothetical protein KY384_005497 [Bacidia gigantensis]
MVGVTKTYKLTYEAAEVTHAVFNQNLVKNTWRISALMLRSLIEYFSAGTEQLDVSTTSGRTTFTSYTEKIMNGKDILKQPLQTSVTIDNLDFEEFEVEENLHIGIAVKDFKAIATHAESLRTSVTARFSLPTHPMQLRYREIGISSDFTLMTIGEYRGGPERPTSARALSKKASVPLAQHSSVLQQQDRNSHTAHLEENPMPPPVHPASRHVNKGPTQMQSAQSTQRASPPRPKPSLDPESLFHHQNDDTDEDRQWGERNYVEEEDTVGWSASAVNVSNPKYLPWPQYS